MINMLINIGVKLVALAVHEIKMEVRALEDREIEGLSELPIGGVGAQIDSPVFRPQEPVCGFALPEKDTPDG